MNSHKIIGFIGKRFTSTVSEVFNEIFIGCSEKIRGFKVVIDKDKSWCMGGVLDYKISDVKATMRTSFFWNSLFASAMALLGVIRPPAAL